MLTMVGHCRQENTIYKCTKLHDHSLNIKWDILCAAHTIFFDVPEGGASYLTFLFSKICFFLCLRHCIVSYCIMRPYNDGPIGPLSYKHSSGVVRNPHSALAEWGIFNLRSISPQETHLLIARRRNSITSILASISWMTCLSATSEPRIINLSITGERITFTK